MGKKYDAGSERKWEKYNVYNSQTIYSYNM